MGAVSASNGYMVARGRAGVKFSRAASWHVGAGKVGKVDDGKVKRAVWDYDPFIEINRPFEDVVSAVWHAITVGPLQDDEISATAETMVPGVVQFVFEHTRAGNRWGRLVVRRQAEQLSALHAIGPEFLRGDTPDEFARADLPAMRKWLRDRHNWRVALWSYVVSEVVDQLQDEFGAVDMFTRPASPTIEAPTVGAAAGLPSKPSEPSQGAKLDEWFRWRADCLRLGYKVTYADIAVRVNLSPGYVKNKGSEWCAEHDKDVT